jgi:hypothetical protein
MAEIQMGAALGSAYRPCMGLKVFLQLSDILIDTIRYAHMVDAEIRHRIVVEGKEHRDAAIGSGRMGMPIT